MKPEPKKKLPNKKVISSAKFEAKEQFTKSALENLKTENERLVNSLKKCFQCYLFKIFLITRNYYFCLISGRQNLLPNVKPIDISTNPIS